MSTCVVSRLGRWATSYLNRQPLPILLRHARAVGELPLIHRDPFDRILLAQARTENLNLLTRDAIVASYGGGVTKV